MPRIFIERAGGKPVIAGDCLDTTGSVPVIDFNLPGCSSKKPQVIIFKIRNSADYSFADDKSYAQSSDSANKPRRWTWVKPSISNDQKLVVEYENDATIWFNLKMKDNKDSGRVVTLDPKIKSGGGNLALTEPIVLLVLAFCFAAVTFATGRYVGMRRVSAGTG